MEVRIAHAGDGGAANGTDEPNRVVKLNQDQGTKISS